MMRRVFVIICETWDGYNYSTEVHEVFNDREEARKLCASRQGNQKDADIRWSYEETELK